MLNAKPVVLRTWQAGGQPWRERCKAGRSIRRMVNTLVQWRSLAFEDCLTLRYVLSKRPGRTTMPTEEPDTKDAVQRLKQEFESLTRQQSEALRRATYVGMNRDEAKKCDGRRENIKKLVAEL